MCALGGMHKTNHLFYHLEYCQEVPIHDDSRLHMGLQKEPGSCSFDAKRSTEFLPKQTKLMTISNILVVNWTCLANDDRYVLNQLQHCFKYDIGSVLGFFVILAFKCMAMPRVNMLGGICVPCAATSIAN